MDQDRGILDEFTGGMEFPEGFEPFNMERGYTLRTASVAAVSGTAFASTRDIGKPLLIQGVLLQTDKPDPNLFVRWGWGVSDIASDTDRANGIGYFETQGSTGVTGFGDVLPLMSGQVFIGPLRIFIKDPGAKLWLAVYNQQSTNAAFVSATFQVEGLPSTDFMVGQGGSNTLPSTPPPNTTPGPHQPPQPRPPGNNDTIIVKPSPVIPRPQRPGGSGSGVQPSGGS